MNPSQSPAVQEALQRRGMGMGGSTPQLSQTSQQAPMQQQTPQPMNPSDMNMASAMPQGATGQAAPSQKFQAQNSRDMALMALAEHVKNQDSLDKEKLKMGSMAPMI